MSRKSDRVAKASWQRTHLARNGFFSGERFAYIRLRCSRCNGQLMIFAQHMDPEHNVGLEFHADSAGAVMYDAGPDDDPTSRFAFDCNGCGRQDIQVRQDRLEQLTADLLVKCRADDTPRTLDVAL